MITITTTSNIIFFLSYTGKAESFPLYEFNNVHFPCVSALLLFSPSYGFGFLQFSLVLPFSLLSFHDFFYEINLYFTSFICMNPQAYISLGLLAFFKLDPYLQRVRTFNDLKPTDVENLLQNRGFKLDSPDQKERVVNIIRDEMRRLHRATRAQVIETKQTIALMEQNIHRIRPGTQMHTAWSNNLKQAKSFKRDLVIEANVYEESFNRAGNVLVDLRREIAIELARPAKEKFIRKSFDYVDVFFSNFLEEKLWRDIASSTFIALVLVSLAFVGKETIVFAYNLDWTGSFRSVWQVLKDAFKYILNQLGWNIGSSSSLPTNQNIPTIEASQVQQEIQPKPMESKILLKEDEEKIPEKRNWTLWGIGVVVVGVAVYVLKQKYGV